MPREPDYLTPNARTILLPAIAPHGFRHHPRRTFSRLQGQILQSISFEKSCWGGDDYRVWLSSWPLFASPHAHGIGDTLKWKNNVEGWWCSRSPRRAAEHMSQVRDLVLEKAIPWFDRTNAIRGILVEVDMAEVEVRKRPGHPQTSLLRACCLARLGDVELALHHARNAVAGYTSFLELQYEGTEEALAQAGSLVAALENDTREALLERWFEENFRRRRFERMLRPSPRT